MSHNSVSETWPHRRASEKRAARGLHTTQCCTQNQRYASDKLYQSLIHGSRQPDRPASYAQIERIAHVAFQLAQKRGKKLCSVEKSNVLETSQLWKEVVSRIAADYPDIELSHM